MTIEVSNWFWEGVMMQGGVLSIDPAYFDLTGGRERWLYRVARKHAGGAGEVGFAIAMPTLFEKSGAEGQYRRFKFEIAKIVEQRAAGLCTRLGDASWKARATAADETSQRRRAPDENRGGTWGRGR
jgi:plasmid replication initiation protein